MLSVLSLYFTTLMATVRHQFLELFFYSVSYIGNIDIIFNKFQSFKTHQ